MNKSSYVLFTRGDGTHGSIPHPDEVGLTSKTVIDDAVKLARGRGWENISVTDEHHARKWLKTPGSPRKIEG